MLCVCVCVCVCVFKAQPGDSDGTESTPMQDTQIQSLAWEDSPGGGNDTHPSVRATDRGAWWAIQSIELQRVGHN